MNNDILRQIAMWLVAKWNGIFVTIMSWSASGVVLGIETHNGNVNPDVAVYHKNNNIYFHQIQDADSLQAIIDSLCRIVHTPAVKEVIEGTPKDPITFMKVITAIMILGSISVSVMTVVGFYWKAVDRKNGKLLK